MATFQTDPWWVAENLTNQPTPGNIGNFVSNAAPSGYQAVKAGSQTDWDTFQQGLSSGNTISLHNITWQVGGGPYPTQAAATAAIPGIQAAKPAPGAVQQYTGASFSSIQNALSAFYDELTNGKMWRSLGWVLLGVALIAIGFYLWIGKDIPIPVVV